MTGNREFQYFKINEKFFFERMTYLKLSENIARNLITGEVEFFSKTSFVIFYQ